MLLTLGLRREKNWKQPKWSHYLYLFSERLRTKNNKSYCGVLIRWKKDFKVLIVLISFWISIFQSWMWVCMALWGKRIASSIIYIYIYIYMMTVLHCVREKTCSLLCIKLLFCHHIYDDCSALCQEKTCSLFCIKLLFCITCHRRGVQSLLHTVSFT